LLAIACGYTILHISDMHVDMSEAAMQHLIELVDGMQYDLGVLTGDYRGKTFAPFETALEGVAKLRIHLKQPIYGVLGNHDTIQPELTDNPVQLSAVKDELRDLIIKLEFAQHTGATAIGIPVAPSGPASAH
jgi:predicted MPP superfamily phosphohydrolase